MITVYLDMDGVIANFDKAFKQYKLDHGEDHVRFSNAVLEGKIFEDLEKMPGADVILEKIAMISDWDYIDVQMLTSVGTYNEERGEEARRQKNIWLQKHGIHYKPNFVRIKTEKGLYAHKFAILIDDSIGCIDPFNEKGGVGILHTRPLETLWKLDKTILDMIEYGAKVT